MSGRTINDILRMRRQGSRLWRIAKDTGQPEHAVAAVLVEARVALWATFERKQYQERK
jgi:hypothetical protein